MGKFYGIVPPATVDSKRALKSVKKRNPPRKLSDRDERGAQAKLDALEMEP